MTAGRDVQAARRSTTWPSLIKRYARYRRMPRWGSMLRVPRADGRMSAKHARRMVQEGNAAVTRLRLAVARFQERCGCRWPETPEPLWRRNAAIERLRALGRLGKTHVRSLWEALVFDRDGYTCQYCGRNAFDFYRQTGRNRTLRLVVDHRTAVGKERNTFSMSNSVTACWSCNTLKGALPEKAFLEELDSLMASRMKQLERRKARRRS